MPDANITFGAWLKRRRRQLDLTQKELAYQAGCSVGTIRKIEADERRPSMQLASLLAQHLDIPPEQRDPFIAFARAEAYTADISFPIPDPVDVQTIAIPAIPQESRAQSVKHNLPSETTSFVGRDTELAALDDLFNNLNRRLVTIVGPGGIGKTRLALTYAEQLVGASSQAHYPNGVFFVNLAPLPSAEQLLLTLAEALGMRLQGGIREKRSPRQQLLDYVRNRRLLLLLDNFEHLLAPAHLSDAGDETGGAGLIADILRAAPEVRILVTSREQLNLHVEQVFALNGLACPDWDTVAPEAGVEDVVEYTAVQLFLQAAQRNQQNFSLETHEELLALVRICHLVGGMPLALELAASWVDTLSLTDIAAELQHGLDILETELRDVPQRQRSVRATFDYSWRKLDLREQSIFAQLSIFRGGFTRLAAQAVAGATLRELSRLVNKSFIQFNKGRDRYQVHELLRQYGADWLGRDSRLERTVYDHHSAYFCRLLGEYTADLKGSGRAQASSAINADIDNVRLAWNHAITQQDLGAIGISLESLFRFHWNNSWMMQGVKEFEKAVAALRTGEPSGKRGVVLGQLLAFLGRMYDNTGQPGNATEILKESIALLQRLGAREETLVPLLFLASQRGSLEVSLEESSRLFHESLALAKEFDDQWAIGHVLLYMGWNGALAGDYKQAEQRWREALIHHRRTGDMGGALWALLWLSSLAVDRGRYEEALSLAQETMSLARELTPDFPIEGLESLGAAMLALGAYDEAEELYQQGLALVRERGVWSWAPGWLFRLGEVAFCMGDYARAAQRYQESLVGALEFDHIDTVAHNHDALGRLNLAQGAGFQAREHLQAALQIAIPLGQSPMLLAYLATIAELLAEEGDLDYATLLAMLITNHPASQAKIKERAAHLLTRLEAHPSANDLANIRRRSRQSDLDTVAAQLLVDLGTP